MERKNTRSNIVKPIFDYYDRKMVRSMHTPTRVQSTYSTYDYDYGLRRANNITAKEGDKEQILYQKRKYKLHIYLFKLNADNSDFEVEQITLSNLDIYLNENENKIYSHTLNTENGGDTYVYIIKNDDDTLKKLIQEKLKINFPGRTAGSTKSKKYVLYNNKRRLVKINDEKKKYIVCDKTDILLSSIRGKFRYVLD